MFNTKDKKTIEEIAATIAHEIKNPLSLVKANIDLLQSADKENVYSKNYHVIKNELDKINDMMVDFLQLTKQTIDKMDLIYMYDIVNTVFENYKISLSTNVDFTLSATDKEICIMGNEQSITRVISNILKNSIEAIDDNGTIDIKLYVVSNDVYITIKDNGKGLIDAKNVGQAFFTTKANGNGLGVSICKKIIAEHSGTFSIKNNTDSPGCIAICTFPVV